MKKFLSALLSATLLLTLSLPVFATEPLNAFSDSSFSVWASVPDLKINKETLSQSSDPIVRENSEYLINEASKIKTMSIDELNEYINNIYNTFNSPTTTRSVQPKGVVNILQLKAAWLAAAQVAKVSGYPCAAKAVEYSVLGQNYTEDDGLFAQKIKPNSAFKKFMDDTKNNKSPTNPVEFTKSEDADLFYALHNVTVTPTKSGSTYKVNVYDKFDFDLEKDYDSIFTDTVNNWAWLCQNTFILHVVEININFTVK